MRSFGKYGFERFAITLLRLFVLNDSQESKNQNNLFISALSNRDKVLRHKLSSLQSNPSLVPSSCSLPPTYLALNPQPAGNNRFGLKYCKSRPFLLLPPLSLSFSSLYLPLSISNFSFSLLSVIPFVERKSGKVSSFTSLGSI